MNLGDATDWALMKALRACEEKRLDPPSEPTIPCYFCNARGYHGETRAERAATLCDICRGSGELPLED